MRELPLFDHREHCMRPVMLRVTVTALGGRIEFVQPSVNGCLVSQFRRNIRMTRIAAVIHCFRFPGSGMTQLAFPRYLRMGRNTT